MVVINNSDTLPSAAIAIHRVPITRDRQISLSQSHLFERDDQ